MLSKMKRYFMPPVFEGDEQKNLRARLLNIINLTLMIALPLLIVAASLSGIQHTASYFSVLAMLANTFVMQYLLRRGAIRLVSLWLIVSGFILITLAVFVRGTVISSTTTAYVTLVIMGGLLFAWPGITVTVALSSLAVMGMLMAENAGMLPPAEAAANISLWATYTAIFGLTGILTYFAYETIHKALERANCEIDGRRQAEAELQAAHDKLEMRVRERTADLRQSEALYRTLFEKAHNGITLFTPNQEVITANQKALDILGYTMEEYQAGFRRETNFTAASEQRADAAQKFAAVLRGETLPTYERSFRHKDGRQLDMEVTLSAVRDEQGQVLFVQSVFSDITERKKARSALQQSRNELYEANQALERALQARDQFMAAMSHELRTPLTAIIGLSEALEMSLQGSASERQLKSLQTINASGQRLHGLVSDLLDYTRLQSGEMELQMGPCALVTVCYDTLRAAKAKAGEKNLEVTFSTSHEVLEVTADERRIKQVLMNLLSNAIKFTPAGGRINLAVTGLPAEGLVRVSVSDSGIGISEENLGRMFQPFVQLDGHLTRSYEGTGLGLALVKLLVERQGGQIEAESVPAQGSTFTVTLPWAVSGEIPAA